MRNIIIAFLFLLSSPCVFADGVDTLVELGRSKDRAARIADEETRNFESVRRAVDDGSICKGQAKDDIRKKYGEPVIMFPEDKNKEETWIYKSADASFFGGPKIYIKFDNNGILDTIKSVEKKVEEKSTAQIEKKDSGKTKNEMPILRKSKRQRYGFQNI